MQKTLLTACLAMLCLAGTQAQSSGAFSRFTFGPEIGSGLALQTCCSDMWGFYTLGANSEYRFTRYWSAEAALRYINMEGEISGYSYGGTGYDFGGFTRFATLRSPSVRVSICLCAKAGNSASPAKRA